MIFTEQLIKITKKQQEQQQKNLKKKPSNKTEQA